MIFALNSAGVRVFFAHFFEEKFCDGRGRGCRSLCGGARHSLFLGGASFGRESRLGGTPLRGAKPCVLGFCVRGVLCVGHGVSWFFANLHLGFGGACGPLARRVAGRRSTGLACCGPAVHWLGVSRAGGPPKAGGVAKAITIY